MPASHVDRRPAILLLEDLPELSAVLRRLLEDAGYDVSVATDGIDAVTRLRDAAPDILVLDLETEPLNGVVALQVLRAAAGRRLPAVLLSTAADAAVLHTAARVGASVVLRKPFRNADLLEAVARGLAERPGTAAEPCPLAATATTGAVPATAQPPVAL